MKPHHYEVHGPGRDYDYSVFCDECNNEACDFAGAWLFDVFDGLEVGETAKVEVDYLRVTGGGESEFIDGAIGADNLTNGITAITRHRLQG